MGQRACEWGRVWLLMQFCSLLSRGPHADCFLLAGLQPVQESQSLQRYLCDLQAEAHVPGEQLCLHVPTPWCPSRT